MSNETSETLVEKHGKMKLTTIDRSKMKGEDNVRICNETKKLLLNVY